MNETHKKMQKRLEKNKNSENSKFDISKIKIFV